jgi:hypothetical protein
MHMFHCKILHHCCPKAGSRCPTLHAEAGRHCMHYARFGLNAGLTCISRPCFIVLVPECSRFALHYSMSKHIC